MNHRELPEIWRQGANLPKLCWYGAQDWLIIIASATAGLSLPWLLPVAWLIIAGRLQGLGVLLHDVCHSQQRRGFWVRATELLCGLPIGTTVAAMRFHHLRHHRNSGTHLDPYLKPATAKSALARWRYRCQGILLVPFWLVRCALGTAAMIGPRVWQTRILSLYGRVFLQAGKDQKLRPALLREAETCAKQEWRQLLWWGIVTIVFLNWPVTTILVYLIPLGLAAMLNANRVLTEHTHVLLSGPTEAELLATTHNHTTGLLNRWVLYPHHIGYHQAHHLYPGVSLDYLPQIQAWLEPNQARAGASAAWSANTEHDQSQHHPLRSGHGLDEVEKRGGDQATP